MTDTVYIITKYYFYDTEWIVYISEDYKKTDKCFNEYKNRLKEQCGLILREYPYDIHCEDSERTIKHIIKENGCLKQWMNAGWRII